MSTEQVKLTEEEVGTIASLSKNYNELKNKFGTISIEMLIFKEQSEAIQKQVKNLNELENGYEKEFTELQSKENEFAAIIQKKYGAGEINLETGFFIPVV